MRVAICGGGTAGHIYPAIALADEIILEEPDSDVVFVGTNQGLESKLVPDAGFQIHTIDAKGFKRKLALENFVSLWYLIRSFFKCRYYFQEFKPNVVVGVGGYVSAAAVLAAYSMKIPTVIHEQNAYPGLANKLLSKIVDVVAVSYPNGERIFPSAKRVVYTGNPIRRKLIGVLKERGLKSLNLDENKKTVLIFGGSQGAKKLNDSIIEGYNDFRSDGNLQIIHLTGEKLFDEVCKSMKNELKADDQVRYQAHPYLKNIMDAYAAADLVVSRAGATTIAELTSLGVPAVLVPYPYATGDHQQKNAEALEQHGAAKIIKDEDISGKKLYTLIESIIYDSATLATMKERSSSLGRPYAANDLAKVVIDESDKIRILKS